MGCSDMKKDSLKYSLAVIIFGTIGVFLRLIKFPSEIVVLCRGVIGTLIVWLYVRIRGRRVDKAAIRKNLLWLALSGVSLGLNWIFLFAAYMHTTVAVASLFNYLAPVMVLVIAPFLYREKLTLKKILCVVAAVIGVVLISGVIGNTNSDISGLGIFFAFMAALGFVGIIFCNKKINGVNAYDKAIVQLAFSALTVLPYVLIKNWGVHIEVDLQSVLLTLMLGLVHTGFTYCLYFDTLGRLPVHSVAVLGYLEPVVSVLCSVLILHEQMDIFGWIGAALIIGAAAVSELISAKKA